LLNRLLDQPSAMRRDANAMRQEAAATPQRFRSVVARELPLEQEQPWEEQKREREGEREEMEERETVGASESGRLRAGTEGAAVDDEEADARRCSSV